MEKFTRAVECVRWMSGVSASKHSAKTAKRAREEYAQFARSAGVLVDFGPNTSERSSAEYTVALAECVQWYSAFGPEELPIDAVLNMEDEDCEREHRALYEWLYRGANEDTRKILIVVVKMINKHHTAHLNVRRVRYEPYYFLGILRDTLHASEKDVEEAEEVFRMGKVVFSII